jgi:septum formation protein
MLPVLCLASASPRRRELLQQLGVPHKIHIPAVDETPLANESAAYLVQRLACLKAEAVWHDASDLPVLAADTTVTHDGQLFGKPQGAEEAVAMLLQLAGKTHQVWTAVALRTATGLQFRTNKSTVHFGSITAEQALQYWHTGEPRDKAGGYAIQGLAAAFIEHLSGSFSGVMGLPLFETAQLLRAANIPFWCTI